jgi:hypothetical protein
MAKIFPGINARQIGSVSKWGSQLWLEPKLSLFFCLKQVHDGWNLRLRKNFSLHLSRNCGNIMIVICGTLAQLEEQLTLNQRVVGSSPSCPITKQYDAQM